MARLIDYDYIRQKALADPDSGEAVVYLQDIAEAPAVDAVEVVHGRWEVYMDGKELMCSSCKTTFWDEEQFGGSNYCPNCGAKMDLEVKNAEE